MALDAGAVAVSDRNRFSDRHFEPLGNFAGFDWGDPDWMGRMDARLEAIEKAEGNFDMAATLRQMTEAFPADNLYNDMMRAAAEIRQRSK
jgi:hypothetical protein